MNSPTYQKLSRIDIAVALDASTSRFCVSYKELDNFVAAFQKWNIDDSVAIDNVLQAGKSHSHYHEVGERVKSDLAYFTTDIICSDWGYLDQTNAKELDIRACLLATNLLWKMGVNLETTMLGYPMVLRNMRSKNYKGIDTLDSMYNHFCKDVQTLVEERIRHLYFAVKAVSLYAPAFGCLHRNMNKTLALVSRIKPQLIEFTQTHNQFVAASHPAISGRALACA